MGSRIRRSRNAATASRSVRGRLRGGRRARGSEIAIVVIGVLALAFVVWMVVALS